MEFTGPQRSSLAHGPKVTTSREETVPCQARAARSGSQSARRSGRPLRCSRRRWVVGRQGVALVVVAVEESGFLTAQRDVLRGVDVQDDWPGFLRDHRASPGPRKEPRCAPDGVQCAGRRARSPATSACSPAGEASPGWLAPCPGPRCGDGPLLSDSTWGLTASTPDGQEQTFAGGGRQHGGRDEAVLR